MQKYYNIDQKIVDENRKTPIHCHRGQQDHI